MTYCPTAASPSPVAAGIIGLETREALSPNRLRNRPQQQHSSGVVVDMGKVVGVLRGHVPTDRGGGSGGGLDDGEEEDEGEEHLGCHLSLSSSLSSETGANVLCPESFLKCRLRLEKANHDCCVSAAAAA